MFRVKFREDATPGYQPAVYLDQVRQKLTSLLRRQGMEFSHRDEAGFDCYAQMRKPKRPSRPTIPRDKKRGPRLAKSCEWYFNRWRWVGSRWRGESAHWERYGIKCPLPAKAFLSDSEAYCDLHASKGEGFNRYWRRRDAEESCTAI